MKFIFYKDNLIAEKFEMSAADIINEFNQTPESKLDAPFERLILNFMMTKYGGFAKLSLEHWNELYSCRQ